MKILLVDDDAHILDALAVGLGLQWPDSVIFTARDGEEAVEAFFEHEPDVVVLDVTMPVKNGLEVLGEIRRVSDVPVVMLTALGDDTSQVRALELGADDYIVKPFGHLVLVARIKALLRRADFVSPLEAVPDFEAGELAVHFQSHVVTLRGQRLKLTPVEYRLLYHLVRNVGHYMPQQALLDRVWGEDYEATTDHLKVFISRLRAKIAPSDGGSYIETERGLGYRFVRPTPAAARTH